MTQSAMQGSAGGEAVLDRLTIGWRAASAIHQPLLACAPQKNSPLIDPFCFIDECGSWHCKRGGVGMKAPWLSTFLIGFATAIFVTSPIASPLDPAAVSVQELTFTKLLCPAGCSKLMKSSLQPFIGGKVQIGPSQFTGPVLDSLFDHCDGVIELRPQQQSRQEQLDELKKIIAPNHKFDTASLHLPESVLTALVVCNREKDGKAGNMARIISIEDGRVLVLFEYLSVLELRKK